MISSFTLSTFRFRPFLRERSKTKCSVHIKHFKCKYVILILNVDNLSCWGKSVHVNVIYLNGFVSCKRDHIQTVHIFLVFSFPLSFYFFIFISVWLICVFVASTTWTSFITYVVVNIYILNDTTLKVRNVKPCAQLSFPS